MRHAASAAATAPLTHGGADVPAHNALGCGVGGASRRNIHNCWIEPNIRYEEFEMPSKNLKHMNMGYSKSEDEKGVGPGDFDAGTPESLPSPERPPLRHIDKYVRPECPCLTKRYTIALLTCIGFIISFGMRCNMGMAKLKKIHGMAVFNWTVAVESAVDSSFFWGYLVTQVPGGFLASAYPANRIFGTAIAISSFMNLLVPGATSLHPACVIIVRICQGFVEGVTYPACHGIWRFWAPPLERSRLATLAFCGSYAGVVLGMPLSGMLAGGISWQAPFYFYGVVGLLWYLFWLWLSFEKPSKHPSISARELQYIEQSLGQSVNQAMPTMSTTPWGAFLTSLPVYAIVVANFCRSWNFYLLVLFQAPYLQSSFNMTIEETGFVGALPHLLMTIIVPLGGMLADHVRKKGYLTTTNVRKVFNCGGFGMEACFFMVVAYAQTKVAATVALTLGVAFSGFAISGFNVNHLDIAPRYASILMGMSNGIGTIAGLICPIAIDNITKDHTRDSWKTVFIMAAMVHLFGVTFYALFASGELQPWAEPAAASPAADKKWNPLDEAYQLDPGRQLPPAGDQPTSPPPPPAPGVPPKRPPPPTQMSTDSMTQSASWGPNYGAVEQTLASQQPPPFSNHIEPVQPENRDAYYNYGDKDSGF
ncbi:vesicular glutamate transporter 1 [Schistocerca americana]|uniref:vesicular glutamate transporter 1 n=1 Tax=Schistocerca americana TaxID=7009 RepID=UPI001F4F624D|nr:vesicular glutamate transporter 1 [Schistocerca americana]